MSSDPSGPRGLIGRRFVIVTGKGGVGKTTVSVALALAAAGHGKRVLLAMCNAKERVSALLGSAPVGHDIVGVAPGIDAVNIDPEASLEEYGMMVLKIRAVYRAVFESRPVRAVLRAVPGMHEWAMLGKAWFHTTEQRGGRMRYDLVIVDAPATGHGLDLMRVPHVILSVAPAGPLRRNARRCWDLMCDRERAEILQVTAPEDMPVNEAAEMHAALTGELGLSVARIVVNRLTPTLFDPSQAVAIERLRAARPVPALAPLFEVAHRRIGRQKREAEQLERLRARVALPQVRLPMLFVERFGKREVEILARRLEEQTAPAPGRAAPVSVAPSVGQGADG